MSILLRNSAVKRLLWIFALNWLIPAFGRAADLELKVLKIPRPVSSDPFDKAWKRATPVEVPLMPQTIAPPGGGGGATKMQVKAMQCELEIFVRLEWEDKSVDDYPSTAEGFTDAAAVEFPAEPNAWPSPFMGDRENAVIIWRWSASAQKDLDQGYQSSNLYRPRQTADLYAYANDVTFRSGEAAGNILSQRRRQSPVENLTAKGFGTLTTVDDQPVMGKGVWKNGRWQVVMRRELGGTPAFWEASRTLFAVAAWDGHGRERNGAKSVSVWHRLALPKAPPAAALSKVERGRRVYQRYGCVTCHGKDALGGVPNPNAQSNPIPALNKVKSGFTREEVRKVIFTGREPVRADPGGAPPPFKMNAWQVVMDPPEADVLVDYLFSLQPKEEEW